MKSSLALIVLLYTSLAVFGQYPIGNSVSNYHDSTYEGNGKILVHVIPKDTVVRAVHSRAKELESDNSSLIVHFTPTNLIDGFSSPSLVGGLECRIYNALSLNLEGGGYLRGWVSTQTNPKGYIFKVEPKLNVSGDGKADWGYLSLEFMYKKQSFDWTDSIMLTPKYVKTFTEYRNVWAITVKAGTCRVFFKRLVVDSYLGLGIRVKNVTSTLTNQEAKNLDYTPPGDIDPSDTEGFMYEIGHFVYPNIELGVRIGYIIKN